MNYENGAYRKIEQILNRYGKAPSGPQCPPCENHNITWNILLFIS